MIEENCESATHATNRAIGGAIESIKRTGVLGDVECSRVTVWRMKVHPPKELGIGDVEMEDEDFGVALRRLIGQYEYQRRNATPAKAAAAQNSKP